MVTLELSAFQHLLVKDAMGFALEVEQMNLVLPLGMYLFQVDKEEQFLQQKKNTNEEMLLWRHNARHMHILQSHGLSAILLATTSCYYQ